MPETKTPAGYLAAASIWADLSVASTRFLAATGKLGTEQANDAHLVALLEDTISAMNFASDRAEKLLGWQQEDEAREAKQAPALRMVYYVAMDRTSDRAEEMLGG